MLSTINVHLLIGGCITDTMTFVYESITLGVSIFVISNVADMHSINDLNPSDVVYGTGRHQAVGLSVRN
jgi:hypothetical protein